MRITKNKRIFIVFVILLLSSFKSSPVFAQTLVILHSDGSTTDVELSTWPEVTFENDNVIIKSTILDLEFPKQDVLRFTYKSKSTDISSLKDSDNIVKDNGQLLFNGIKSPDMISVFTLEGVRVPVNLVRNSDSVTLPLNGFYKGVYLINVNGRTSKFVVK